MNTFGSNYDTTLSAYIVDSAGAAQIACNDDTNGLQSQLQVNLIAGVTYTFMVGAYASARRRPGHRVLRAPRRITHLHQHPSCPAFARASDPERHRHVRPAFHHLRLGHYRAGSQRSWRSPRGGRYLGSVRGRRYVMQSTQRLDFEPDSDREPLSPRARRRDSDHDGLHGNVV